MAKARAGFHGPVGLGLNQLLRGIGGPEYIASFLVGFTGEEKEEAGVTLYENVSQGRLRRDAPGALRRRRHLRRRHRGDAPSRWPRTSRPS